MGSFDDLTKIKEATDADLVDQVINAIKPDEFPAEMPEIGNIKNLFTRLAFRTLLIDNKSDVVVEAVSNICNACGAIEEELEQKNKDGSYKYAGKKYFNKEVL